MACESKQASEASMNTQTKEINIRITWKDLIAQAEDEGISLTPKRAMELMNEHARGIEDGIMPTICDVISDCILSEIKDGEEVTA